MARRVIDVRRGAGQLGGERGRHTAVRTAPLDENRDGEARATVLEHEAGKPAVGCRADHVRAVPVLPPICQRVSARSGPALFAVPRSTASSIARCSRRAVSGSMRPDPPAPIARRKLDTWPKVTVIRCSPIDSVSPHAFVVAAQLQVSGRGAESVAKYADFRRSGPRGYERIEARTDVGSAEAGTWAGQMRSQPG